MLEYIILSILILAALAYIIYTIKKSLFEQDKPCSGECGNCPNKTNHNINLIDFKKSD